MDTGSYVPVYFVATLRACFLEKKGHVGTCFISLDDIVVDTRGCGVQIRLASCVLSCPSQEPAGQRCPWQEERGPAD